MRVTHFQRKPTPTDHSIEHLFEAVRAKLPASVQARVAVSRYRSHGVLPRLYDIVEAALRQGDVNHVTGDVHFLTFLLRRDRTVLTIHDAVFMTQTRGWRREVLKLLWYTLPAKRAARITTISEFSKQQLLGILGVPESRVTVVPDCIDERFQPKPKPFDAVKPRILQVGTRPNKNLERVVPALEGIPCALDIIGRLSDAQRALLAKHRIEYTQGHQLPIEEVVARYEACDFLLFASTYEGFGMPIVEAQRVGRPVITSRTCSMPEVGGDGALYVDPEDVGSIRAAVQQLLGDPTLPPKLVEAGFRNQARFSAERIAKAYAEVYAELAPR